MLAKGRMVNEEQKQRAYELMMGESDRLRRLVESLLDLGRMQAGSYRFEIERLDVSAWAKALACDFQETVRAKGFQVAFSSSADGVLVQGDREALSGALWNLLDNAVKYSPSPGHIEMSVSCRDDVVEIAVSDQGMGIPKHDLKHVFDRFYRGANTKAEGIAGTGIGLAMVKEIVEAHNGTVRAESEPGAGSVFRVTLPCKEF
jgi:signal transduction histidine kinase